jgi:hypothetical protein
MTDSTTARRLTRGISHSLFIVLFLLTCGVRAAQNDEHRVRNIVLVHGAWADGSGWKGVYDNSGQGRLQRQHRPRAGDFL